jgi:ferrochelatase
MDLAPYDGILLVSFGGPEAPEEVRPFLERVVAGRGVPPERLDAVAEPYFVRGGVSPINDENRALIAALEAELARRGIDVPVLWGNRNAAPFLAEALAEARDRGMQRLVAVLTSAYSSYSSCRQYREDLAAAAAEVPGAPEIDKIPPYAHTAGFGEAVLDLVQRALATVEDPGAAHVLFVTHSIPEAMNDTSGPGDGPGGAYALQHVTLAREVLARLGADGSGPGGGLAFCSRSGPPSVPWLEPDVNDRLRELAAEGVREVVVVPIGFVADHMEVVHDLDTEAAETAEEVGIRLVRVPTVRTHETFVRGLVDLLQARALEASGEHVELTAWPTGGRVPPSTCPPGCCPNLRVHRPALCGRDGA